MTTSFPVVVLLFAVRVSSQFGVPFPELPPTIFGLGFAFFHWWMNLKVCSLIVNPAHVKAIVAADDPAHVTEELKSICTSTTLGARIFGQVLS